MPQVKELKELGVAGSATNERGRYGSGWRGLKKVSRICLFLYPLEECYRLPKKAVTSYKQRLLQVINDQELLQVTSKDRYTQRLLHVAGKDCCRLTCNRLPWVTCNNLLSVT